jgi:hypothetical protein
MARAFAYSASGTPIPGTKKLTTLYFQDENLDYSSNPGGLTWWQGPDENLGYVITRAVPSQDHPTPLGNIGSVKFFRTSSFTESEFISLAQSIAGQTFVSGDAAKIWLNSNNYWTSYESIYNPTLQVYLDAGNSSSYGGVGSTWNDLSGTGNNATLINTPTYNSSSGGYFNFSDTSFEYASIPDIGDLSTWTIEAWARPQKSLTGKVTSIVCNQFDLSTKLNFSLGTNNAPSNYNLTAGFFDGSWKSASGYPVPTLNTWYHFVGTYDGSTVKLYVNGSLSSSFSVSGTPQSGGEIRIARRWDSASNNAVNFFDGDISIVRVYGSALSLVDVQGNFNASRHRYSI